MTTSSHDLTGISSDTDIVRLELDDVVDCRIFVANNCRVALQTSHFDPEKLFDVHFYLLADWGTWRWSESDWDEDLIIGLRNKNENEYLIGNRARNPVAFFFFLLVQGQCCVGLLTIQKFHSGSNYCCVFPLD